jgi:HEAT repeat protein
MTTLSTTESVAGLIERIQSKDEAVSTAAWQSAGPYGADAVKPLAALMASTDMEMARRARRALERIVRHASHPGLKGPRKRVEKTMLEVIPTAPVPVRRALCWLLSEIGSDSMAAGLAPLLTDSDVREDARCALTRLHTPAATKVLRKAFASAPEEFKPALAQSLRELGEKVEGYPSQKLIPVKPTSVKPVASKS